jgi:hypothetical protein
MPNSILRVLSLVPVARAHTMLIGFRFGSHPQTREAKFMATSSPCATVTIDGKQLPPPPMKFGGVVQEDAKNSKSYWGGRPTCRSGLSPGVSRC